MEQDVTLQGLVSATQKYLFTFKDPEIGSLTDGLKEIQASLKSGTEEILRIESEGHSTQQLREAYSSVLSRLYQYIAS